VQVDPELLWVASLTSNDPWRGHVMMFELPPTGLRRRERQALTATIEELAASLPNMSREARDGTVRMAGHQMTSSRF
jgi:hypothetical protein